MLVSMTGFGQAMATNGGSTVTVEIRSVNHRFLDLSFKLPRTIQNRESEIKEIVRRKLARGRVTLTIAVESTIAGRSVALNEVALDQYVEQLQRFAKKRGLDPQVGLDALVQLPEAVIAKEVEPGEDELWGLVEKSLSDALEQCSRMRVDEGAALERDLAERMRTVHRTIDVIEKLVPGMLKKQADALRKRVAQLAGDAAVSEERLVTEIVLLADRSDFTEELTRLRSHEDQFNRALKEGGEVSKKLTYLLQEMHREASTIGAKASDAEVIQHVIVLKEETEKLREQVQNLE